MAVRSLREDSADADRGALEERLKQRVGANYPLICCPFFQFGYLGGLGMVTTWACAFLAVPVVAAWLSGPAGS